MAKKPHDPRQGDLLSWEQAPPVPTIVSRFDAQRLRNTTWRDRISLAVSATLKDCSLSREAIAERMGEFLGEPVTASMLDQYASQASEVHTIPFARVIALSAVTGDRRLLQLAADPCDWVVIEERYVGAVDAEIAADQVEYWEQKKKAARRKWKGPR